MQDFDRTDSQNSDDQFISFECPHCQNSVSYLDDTAGSIQVCPHCAQDFIVPDADGQSSVAVPLPITTPRLSLRLLRAEDFEDLVDILVTQKQSDYLESQFANEDGVGNWLEKVLDSNYSVSRQITIGIEAESNKKLIGLIYLSDYGTTQRQMDLNVIIHPDYQNQKLGTEAVLAVLNFCLRDIGQHRIVATCDTRQQAAVRLFTRSGMRQEAQLLKDHYINGEWADSFSFALLETEFGIACRQ